MSCSAQLPVYVLLTTLLFADRPGTAGLAFARCYMLGAGAALMTAKLFGGTILKGRARPMILELPTYKMPSLRNALPTAKDQGLTFLTTAGTVIVAICIVMWWLSAYPKVPPSQGVEAERAVVLTVEADVQQSKDEQAGSFSGRFGRLALHCHLRSGAFLRKLSSMVSSRRLSST